MGFSEIAIMCQIKCLIEFMGMFKGLEDCYVIKIIKVVTYFFLFSINRRSHSFSMQVLPWDFFKLISPELLGFKEYNFTTMFASLIKRF